jgi:hypothetical protein
LRSPQAKKTKNKKPKYMKNDQEYREMILESNISNLKKEIADNQLFFNRRVEELNSALSRGKFDPCYAVNITSALYEITAAACKLEVLEEMKRTEKYIQNFSAKNA